MIKYDSIFLLYNVFVYSVLCVGLFGGRGRGMPGVGRGQQQPDNKKPGKPQGVKNQH